MRGLDNINLYCVGLESPTGYRLNERIQGRVPHPFGDLHARYCTSLILKRKHNLTK